MIQQIDHSHRREEVMPQMGDKFVEIGTASKSRVYDK